MIGTSICIFLHTCRLMIRGGLQFHRVPQYAIQPSTSGSTAMSIRHAWNDILSAQGDWPEEARYEGNTGKEHAAIVVQLRDSASYSSPKSDVIAKNKNETKQCKSTAQKK